MARKKGAAPTMMGYFRKQFEAHPEWLKPGSNASVIDRWKKDHPGQDFTPQHRQSLANAKSLLKKRSAQMEVPATAVASNAAPVMNTFEASNAAPVMNTFEDTTASDSTRGLESLEYAIDECLAAARLLDPERLGEVIKHLRYARNGVILAIG